MEAHGRSALFISHANPESNQFARWLGAKLAGMGYEVWADVMRLHGGSDWSRELELALRERAAKMLLACTPAAMDKQGVRNEIEMAWQLATSLNDPHFIIPLRLEPFTPHFRITSLQYVDFSHSWARGLTEVVEQLISSPSIPRTSVPASDAWLPPRGARGTTLINRPERLSSNWLHVATIPPTLSYYEIKSGFPIERLHDRTAHEWPIVPFQRGVLSFSKADALESASPVRHRATIDTDTLLRDGWATLDIRAWDARRYFSDLCNQSLARLLQARSLSSYQRSAKRQVWWGNIRSAPKGQVRFEWPDRTGARQIIGQSGKRGVHWHYAIGADVRTAPIRHVRLSAGLVFSENGLDPIADPQRSHRLRRSFAKSWRNPRWRDMLDAFVWWLSEGAVELRVPVSSHQELVLSLPTIQFSSPVTVMHDGDVPPDEDDPDVDFDAWPADSDDGELDG